MHFIIPGVMITNMIEYNIIRSNRRTLEIEITQDCHVLVRAPLYCSAETIDKFISEKENWLIRNLERQLRREEQAPKPLNPMGIETLKNKARLVIHPKVEYYAKQMRVVPTAIKITTARKRYGSCSVKNSLCFSCFLIQSPEEAVDLVVVHELCHIRHKNHGTEFYRELASILPDWQERKKKLIG